MFLKMFLDYFISNNRLFSQTSKAELSFNVSEIVTKVIILVPLVPNSIYSYFLCPIQLFIYFNNLQFDCHHGTTLLCT